MLANNKHNTINYCFTFLFIIFIQENVIVCYADDPLNYYFIDSVNVHQCRKVNSDKGNCAKENKILIWKAEPYNRTTFDSDDRHTVSSIGDCWRKCDETESCTQVTYGQNGYCWLGSNATVRQNDNYESSLLFCCYEYEVPVDHSNLPNCELVTSTEKVACHSSKTRVLVWKTEVKKTFSISTKITGTPDECRRLCAHSPICDRVTYDNSNNCWLSSYAQTNGATYSEDAYNSSFLYCCREEAIPYRNDNIFDCLGTSFLWQNFRKECEIVQDRIMVWQTFHKFLVARWNTSISQEECRIRCENDSNCFKFAYNTKSNYCLTGPREAYVDDPNYNTSIMHCCYVNDIPIDKQPVYNCDRVPEVKGNCVNNKNKILVWKTQISTRFNSSLKMRTTFQNCRQRCENKAKCKQFTFNDKTNECWFSIGYEETYYDEKSFNTYVLQCCDEDIPIDNFDKNEFNCQRLPGGVGEKGKCNNHKSKFLLWKKGNFEASFESSNVIKANPEECRQKCARDPNCNQVSFSIINNDCLLGTDVEIFFNQSYRTDILHCCQKDTTLNVKVITTNEKQGGTELHVTAILQHKKIPSCRYEKILTEPQYQLGTYEYSANIKGCPKKVYAHEFTMNFTCTDYRKQYYDKWAAGKVEVEMGETKFCFLNYGWICKGNADKYDMSVRSSQTCVNDVD